MDVLERLAPIAPIVAKILEYRQITKLQSTYVLGLQDYILEDGKIHTRYMQDLTQTGRLSSVDPNLQNIPVRLEQGRLIRKAFVPSTKDAVLLSSDYSQIELRVLAHISGDEHLIAAFKEGADIHTSTAMRVFGIEKPEDVTPNDRRNAKAVNFGIVYGISDFGLSNNLGISRKKAKEYIDTYLSVILVLRLIWIMWFVKPRIKDMYQPSSTAVVSYQISILVTLMSVTSQSEQP